MPEQSESSLNPQPVIDEVQSIHDVEVRRPRLRTVMAAASLAVSATLGLGVLASEPASAESTVTGPQPSMTYEQKAQTVEVAGHRGLEGWYNGRYAIEDSIRAAKNAIAKGADADELDVRLDKYGKPWVNHDATTGRTAKSNLLISHTGSRRLSKLHLKNGDHFPSLYDFAKAMSPYHKKLVVEVKDPKVSVAGLRRINNILREFGFNSSNLSYESFYQGNLARMRTVQPDVPRYLINGNTKNPLRAGGLNRDVLDGVIIPWQAVVNGLQSNPNYIMEYRNRGMGVMPWNVDTVTQMRRAINANVTGFISNDVNRVKYVR
jgi:glycerophosphoryl diester phosphodiesterase